MSTWAYQVENFEPSPDEELVCSICQGVFNDPVQSHCQHVFCRSCLSQWLARSHTCPVCRQTVSTRTIRSAPPLVRSLIGKLRVKCPVCVSDPMSIEDAGKHRCPEALVRCRACRGMIKRCLILDHRRRTCPQRNEQCLKCRLRLPPRPVEEAASAYPARTPKHDCVKALRKKLKDQGEELKDKHKRIDQLLERIHQLEEQLSTQNGTSSQSSSSDDDDILSDSSLSNDDEVVINIESIDDSTSSGEDEDDPDIGWFSRFLEVARSVPPEPEEESADSREAVLPERAPKRRRPGTHAAAASAASAGEPTAHSSHTTENDLSPFTFNRTIAMLQQYNLESDDEWVPPRPLDQLSSESSDMSSPSFLDSLRPDELEEPHWVSSLLDDQSDDDPDWTPL